MRDRYRLYAWELSYFSGKVRAYLRYKGIPFDEEPIDFFGFSVVAKRRAGASAIPIVVTPEGEWIQDSSVILDRLEARFPARAIVPRTPVQRFVAYLLELWGDEFWIPTAMHTRWNHPENYPLFEREVGDHLLPHFPRFARNRAAAYAANRMRAHREAVGFVPSQAEKLERWTHAMLDRLDRHFAEHPYLLGARPSLADFALTGPLYGHLGRDPWPKRELIAKRPNVRHYIDRMASPPPIVGEFLDGDRLPETLWPIVEVASREMLPWVSATRDAVTEFASRNDTGRPIPRGLGMIEFRLDVGTYRRAALPYVLWMVQRMSDVQRAQSAGDQASVRRAMAAFGGEGWLDLDLPRVERQGLRIRLASPSTSTREAS